jgi:GGDEF domain-containing protein
MVAGDVCITAAGRRLAAMMTAGSLPFHISGDEFLVLLSTESHSQFSADFESKIASFNVTWDDKELAVRAAAGIALPDGTATLDQLRKRAEKACKYAKWFGKNVILWAEEIESKLPGERRWRCDKCHAQISVVANGVTPESVLTCPICIVE